MQYVIYISKNLPIQIFYKKLYIHGPAVNHWFFLAAVGQVSLYEISVDFHTPLQPKINCLFYLLLTSYFF